MKKYILNIICFAWLLQPPAAVAEIKTALIVPQSGEFKIWGDQLADGVKTAITEINNNGGLKGKKMTLMVIDDPCSENLAVTTAEMLAVSKDNKPNLVIGPYCSNGFDKIADIFTKAKIFQIVPMMLNADYNAKKYKGLIHIAGVKEQLGTDFFDFYNKHFAGRHLSILYNQDNEEAANAKISINEAFRRHGKGSLVHEYALDSVSDTVTDNIEDNIVFILGKSKEIAKTIRELKKHSADLIIVTEKYMTGDSLIEYASDYLDDVYFMGLPSFENNPEYAEQLVKLRLKGFELDGLNIYGYAAVKAWERTVIAAKSFNYENLTQTAGKTLSTNLWNNAGTKNKNNTLHYVFYRYVNGEFILSE